MLEAKKVMELKTWFLTLLTTALLFTGGNGPVRNAVRPMRVVTEVTVETADRQAVRYTRQEKMSKVLNYLRHMDPWDPPARDLEHAEPDFGITVFLSDGTQVRYEQRGTEYLRKEHGPWMKIHPERGLRLWLILAAVPGDPVTESKPPATPAPGNQPESGSPE